MTRCDTVRHAVPVVLAAALLAGCQQAQETVEPALRAEVQAPPTIRVWPAPDPEVLELQRKLDRPIPEIRRESVGLDEAINRLRELGHINIHVHWPLLEDASYERDHEVVLKADRLRLGRVLDLILEQVSGPDIPLAYTVRDNVVVISTREDLQRDTDVRVYDLRPLIAGQSVPLLYRRVIDSCILDSAIDAGVIRVPHGYSHRGMSFGLVDALKEAYPPPQTWNLIDAIRQVVEPESWRETGGSRGTLHYVRGLAVIEQDALSHRKVQCLLDSLLRLYPYSKTASSHHDSDHRQVIRVVTAQVDDVDGPSEPCRRKMNQRLPKLRLQKTPFDSVIALLRDMQGLPIHVRKEALDAAGIERNQDLSVNLRNIRFQTALDLILRDVVAGDVPPTYTAANGGILISTADDLDRLTVTRLYDIRPLIELAVRLPEPMERAIAHSVWRLTHHPPPSTQPATALSSLPADQKQRLLGKYVADIIRRGAIPDLLGPVYQSVAPDSWRGAGGWVGSLREFDGVLVVTHTPAAQRQIARLLQALLDALDGYRPGPATQPTERGGQTEDGTQNTESRRTRL